MCEFKKLILTQTKKKKKNKQPSSFMLVMRKYLKNE